MKETVARIVQQFTDQKLLAPGELDDAAIGVLEKFEGKVRGRSRPLSTVLRVFTASLLCYTSKHYNRRPQAAGSWRA
jgi:hypothetical protein